MRSAGSAPGWTRCPPSPPPDGPAETAAPWHVRETLLGTGRYAAIRLGRWAQALDLNAVILTSERGRQAPAADIARTRFNDHWPLLRLGRTEEALAVLLEVRQVFEDAHDIQALGATLSGLAEAEDQRGHGDAAVRLERDALRYSCLAGDVTAIRGSYHNLGTSAGASASPARPWPAISRLPS